MGDRPFPVGAAHVDGFIAVVGAMENLVERETVLQPLLVCFVANPLVLGHLIIQILECFVESHWFDLLICKTRVAPRRDIPSFLLCMTAHQFLSGNAEYWRE